MILEIKVVPNAKYTKWALDAQGALKCYLKSAPEKGRANNELVALIAKMLAIPMNNVRIISGITGRNKRISITGDFSYKAILRACGLEYQKDVFE